MIHSWRRKGVAVALASATASLGIAVAGPSARADSPSTPGLDEDNSKGVVEEVPASDSGSYIVVLSADPLLGEFSQDELGSKAAEAKGRQIDETHDELLDAAGSVPTRSCSRSRTP